MEPRRHSGRKGKKTKFDKELQSQVHITPTNATPTDVAPSTRPGVFCVSLIREPPTHAPQTQDLPKPVNAALSTALCTHTQRARARERFLHIASTVDSERFEREAAIKPLSYWSWIKSQAADFHNTYRTTHMRDLTPPGLGPDSHAWNV